MTNDTLKTASVLAFERKLDPSDAMFASGQWAKRDDACAWTPISIRTKSVRGTISNRLKTKDQDPAKLDAAIENPNLQTVDVCTLPADADTLRVQFTVRILGGCGTPSACNNNAYREKLIATVAGYAEQHGFGELAHRYAINLANGRFLWRNRLVAENITVQVRQLRNGETEHEWHFDALDQAWRSFDATADTRSLGKVIEAGLSAKHHVLLQVTAFVRTGAGQEVFPSQELILGRNRGEKSKTLYEVSGVAAMHSQKIGNALRTIDTWYPDYQNDDARFGPIAVEPYGSVTTQGKAYRQPKVGEDFYHLLDNWLLKDDVPAEGNQHFVIATLIRGGVFGAAS